MYNFGISLRKNLEFHEKPWDLSNSWEIQKNFPNPWTSWLIRETWQLWQNGGANNLGLLQDWFHQEIRSSLTPSPPPPHSSPLFNLQKFQKSQKGRMHWNLMDDEEFWALKVWKLKYRRRDQIIQLFCRMGSPPKTLGPSSWICGNLNSFRKVLPHHVECFKI